MEIFKKWCPTRISTNTEPNLNMKSLKFTMFRDKLMNETKDQTYRCLFVPSFDEGEFVKLKYFDEFLYVVKILKIYPKRIIELDIDEAKRDGFTSIEKMQDGIMLINNVKSKERWGFVIRFKKDQEMTLKEIENMKKKTKKANKKMDCFL